jgi:polysaccharide biosynthesis transport protein
VSNIYEALRRSEALARAAQQGGVSKRDAHESSEPVPPFPREVFPPGSTPANDVAYPTEGAPAEGPNRYSPGEHVGPGVRPRTAAAPASDSGLVVASPGVGVRSPRPFESPVSESRESEPDAHDTTAELRRLVWVLFRRKWQVLLIACLVVIPVAVATYSAERLYRSIAQVQIEPEPLQVLPYRDIDLPRYTPNYEFFMKSQEQVLRGSALMSKLEQRVRTDPDLQSEVRRLNGGLAIQRLEGTQIFLLGYVSPDPVVAAKVANLYAEEYIKLHFEGRQEVREKARQLLERELESLEARVQQSEKQLVTYAQENNIPVGPNSISLLQQKLAALGGLASTAESEVFVAQTRLDSLQKASVTDFPERLVTPVVSEITAKLIHLEAELTVLRTRFGENWPAVMQKRTEIDLAQQQLAREKAAALAVARDQALLDYEAAKHKQQLFAGSLAEQKQLVNDQEKATVSYDIIRREVDTNRNMYDAMLERLKQTSVTAGMEFGGLRIVNPAFPSYRPDSPNVKWNLSLAVFLGFALGVCFVLVRDFWSTSIFTIEEVEQLTALPVLGAVPHVQALMPSTSLLPRIGTSVVSAARRAMRAKSPAEPAHSPVSAVAPAGRLSANSLASEAVRNVCASILLSRSGRPPRILMVTSAVPGEGKTTLAIELALALAESGARTLLVECDMRRPTFGTIFGIGEEGGLSLHLSGLVGPTPVIHATANSQLYVVGAGPIAPNPPALLNSEKLQSFLASMTSSFGFIILDAPPALAVADARVLAPLTEGVILTVRAGVASKKMVRRACTLLQHTNLLGVILNAAPTQEVGHPDYATYGGYYQT